MTALPSRLLELLGPVVGDEGVELEDVSVTAAGRRSVVRVVVDKDGGLPLDDVAGVSRVVSAALDDLDAAEPGLLGATFVLEVSSPGVDRPLTTPRHWRRNVGRTVRAVPVQAAGVSAVERTGRLLRADAEQDGGVLLEVDGQELALTYAELARGIVQVEFSRAAADTDEGQEQS